MKTKDLVLVTGLASEERLMHFQCGACLRWWAIGDPPSDQDEWYCPWCGTKQHFSLAGVADPPSE